MGRRPELAALSSHLAALERGEGAVVLVLGQAGLGKTRLVEEALRGRQRVGRGYADDDLGAPPLWPWLRACAAAGLSDVVDVLEGLPSLGSLEPSEAAAARFRWLAETADLVVRQDVPLVLVLEDLHWADRATLDLLRSVAAVVASSPVAVLATSRPGGVDHDTQLALLQRFPSTRTLDLAPFSLGDVGAYLSATEHDPRDAPRVRDETGGLPLLVTARTDPGDGGADTSYDVRRIALRMLGQTQPDHRRVIVAAAVLGEEVDPALMATVLDLGPSAVGSAVEDATSVGLLDSRGERFSHALIRDAVAATQPDADALHRGAAEALAARPGVPAARVANSFAMAGPGSAAEAAAWFQRAAVAASSSLAHEDALRFLRSSLAALAIAGADADDTATTRLDLAQAAYLAGHHQEAIEACQVVSEEMDGRRPDLVCEAALLVQGLSFPDADLALVAMTRRALGTSPGTAVRSRLLAQLATIQANTNDLASAEGVAAEAWALAQESADPEALLEAAQARENVLAAGDVEQERMELSHRAIEQARSLRRPVAEALGQGWRLRAAYGVVDLPQVDDSITALGALAKTSGLPLVQWRHLRARTARSIYEGDFDAAGATNDEAEALAESMGDPSAAGLSTAVRVQIAIQRGSGAGAEPFRRVENAPSMHMVTMMQSLIALVLGEEDETLAGYRRLRPLLWEDTRRLAIGGVLFRLLDLVEHFGDVEAASQILTHLQPVARVRGSLGISTAFFIAPVPASIARALVLLGRHAEAEPNLRVAIASGTALRGRPYVAESQADLAAVLLAIGDASARGEARDLATAALREARALGLDGLAARAQDLLAQAADERLSPREREIVGLVLEALSNREIADRLVISERTVESHVRSVLAKLGCASRTELIARRSELGL